LIDTQAGESWVSVEGHQMHVRLELRRNSLRTVWARQCVHLEVGRPRLTGYSS
jgi:hypothetical protein